MPSCFNVYKNFYLRSYTQRCGSPTPEVKIQQKKEKASSFLELISLLLKSVDDNYKNIELISVMLNTLEDVHDVV